MSCCCYSVSLNLRVEVLKFVRTRLRLHTLRLSASPFFRSLLGYPLTN